MTGILLSIAIVAVFAVTAAVRAIVARVQQQREALRMLILSKGWRRDESAPGSMLRISGVTDDINWTLESATMGKTSTTRWWTEDVVYPELVMSIRSRRTFQFLHGRMGKFMTKLAEKNKQAEETYLVGDLVEKGEQVRTTSGQFVVTVRPGAGLDDFLTPELERALDRWSAVKLHPTLQQTLSVDAGEKLRVYCGMRVKQEHLELFIDIGVQAARALKP